jgi:hypothetical protein
MQASKRLLLQREGLYEVCFLAAMTSRLQCPYDTVYIPGGQYSYKSLFGSSITVNVIVIVISMSSRSSGERLYEAETRIVWHLRH